MSCVVYLALSACSLESGRVDAANNGNAEAGGADAAALPFEGSVQPITTMDPGTKRVVYVGTNLPGEDHTVALQITYPSKLRYDTTTGVVVSVQTFFTLETGDFYTLEAEKEGLIHVSYLWPGWKDAASGAQSAGTYDYGGPTDIAALASAIAFATGVAKDQTGHTLADHVGGHAEAGNVGLFAFSHPGIAAINALADYGETIGPLAYFVGRENPTFDAESTVELGYFTNKGNGPAALNPLYNPSAWTEAGVAMNYSSIRYDSASKAPYFDLDGDKKLSSGDYPFGDRIPTMRGKLYYSSALLSALEASNTLSPWPSDLATAADALRDWPYRTSSTKYATVKAKLPNLKVMLLFAARDHVQPSTDKPHIRHAYEGLGRGTGALWLRLNPDASYMDLFKAGSKSKMPDTPAGTVVDAAGWKGANSLAYDGVLVPAFFAECAALAEMADRTHAHNDAPNLDGVLVNVGLVK